MGRPIDTSAEARRRQLDGYRAMTPEQRLRLADEMSADALALARAGIRARAGGLLGEEEVDAELVRILRESDGRAATRERRPIKP